MNWKGVKDVKANNLAKRGRRSDQLIQQLEDAEIQGVVKECRHYIFYNWRK